MFATEEGNRKMDARFEEYLDSVQVPAPLKARVDQLLTDFKPLMPETPAEIFISDFFDGENVRRYNNVIAFSQHLIMELKNFVQSDNIDFALLTKNVEFLYVQKVDFDLVTAGPKSRLNVNAKFCGGTPMGFQAQAAANNCMNLVRIVKTRIVPNLSRSPSEPPAWSA
jgi:hypothetical protein